MLIWGIGIQDLMSLEYSIATFHLSPIAISSQQDKQYKLNNLRITQ